MDIQEFHVLWADYPLEDAKWEPEDNFSDKEALYEDLESGRISECN